MSYFRVESSGTLSSSDIFRSSDQSFAATNCVWKEKVSYHCLTMNLYSFVPTTRHNFLSIYQTVVLKEFWRFFWTQEEAFISTLHLNLTIYLFWSYLLGRTKTTQNGPHISSRVGVTCGIPQGSILGPLRFLLYNKLNFYLLADDTNILHANMKITILNH